MLRLSRRTLIIIHDLVMASLVLPLAYVLRVGVDGLSPFTDSLIVGTPMFVACTLVASITFGMHRGLWRYASVPDAVCIAKTVTFAVLLFVLAMAVTAQIGGLPRSVPFIQWMLLVILLGGPRMTYRLLRDWRHHRANRIHREQVLLVGDYQAAHVFIRATQADRTRRFKVVGVLDDKATRKGFSVYGVPILGIVRDLPEIVAGLRRQGIEPKRLVLSDPQSARQHLSIGRLFTMASDLGLDVSRLPSLLEFSEAQTSEVDVRPVSIEDIVGRPERNLDLAAVRELVAGRRVLVTGAGGTIGSELASQLAELNPRELVLLDFGEYNLYAIDMRLRRDRPELRLHPVICDIRDQDRVNRVFADCRPELVFHAAALKHVPLVEANPGEGVLTNTLGTRNVADAAKSVGALALVQVSTDKAVNPTSVMGASKRLAEQYCQSLDLESADLGTAQTRFLTVRFGNVLESSGSVVPLFRKQIERGGPVTVTHPDIRRYFMTVTEAVRLILQASAHGVDAPREAGWIFVLDMGEPVRIADLAEQMIRLSGRRPHDDIAIVFKGLRPGEKLYEDLFDVGEQPLKTSADGVLAAAPVPVDISVLRRGYRELEAAARGGDEAELRRLIKVFVPSFQEGVGSPPAADRPAFRAAAELRSD